MFPPVPTSGHPIDFQETAQEYIHHYPTERLKDIKVDSTLHDAQEELLRHIKNTFSPLGCLTMFTNGQRNVSNWVTSSSRQSQKNDELDDGEV
jgi:hypothetical protein